MADYRQLAIPVTVLAYVENFKNIQNLAGIQRQKAFFTRASTDLATLDRKNLSPDFQYEYDLIAWEVINRTRTLSPATRIEVLVPDFRGRLDKALTIFQDGLPDVMNHNLETVPRLYKEARPGADYLHSLQLLRDFKARYPGTVTKSGLMVGLGETDEEILQVMREMREHHIDMLTIGQYLQPSEGHLPVRRYVHPDVFKMFEAEAYKMGFVHAAVGAMVRSSYHADQQAHGVVAGE